MRDRSSVILFIFIVLLILILAQNGMLGALFAGPNVTPLPTVRPLVFSTARPTTPPNVIFPTVNLPTAYAPTIFVPGQPPSAVPSVGVTAPPGAPGAGVVSSGGQCIVPNGWVAYTVQAGDTLAAIAASYNLTVDQLAAANCLQDPDLIYEGQVLAVPGP